MINTRIFEWEEYKKPTVQIFSRYEINQWIKMNKEYEVHITDESITEYTRNKLDKWTQYKEERNVWLGVNAEKSWKPILDYRNKLNSSVCFSFYLNSIVGLDKTISETIKVMNEGDSFVFNSPFAKKTFDKVVDREKLVVYSTYSVSVANIDLGLLKHAQQIKKKDQICLFSRLNPYKNTHQILEALAEGNWQGKIIIGILPNNNNIGKYYMDYLEGIIRDRNLDVEGMRSYDQDEINKIMSQSLACIVSSTSFEETQGKVIIEAANNCCLPVTNRWNGHQDYLPRDYEGIVDTKWNAIDGISIDKRELIERITNIITLYETKKEQYAKKCMEIMQRLSNISTNKQETLKPRRTKHYNYVDYVEHFARLKIDKKWRTCNQEPSYNIDFYIWLRQVRNEDTLDQKLRLDYQCLNKHERSYEYGPLLDLITSDCLFKSIWSKEYLLKIVQLIESKKVYDTWCRQSRLLFTL